MPAAMPVAAARIDNAAYAQRATKMQFFAPACNMLPKINAFKDRPVMQRVIYNSYRPPAPTLCDYTPLRVAIYAIFKYGRRLRLKAKARIKVVKFSRSFA